MLINCLAACAHLTVTVYEIQRDIGRKSSIFSYFLAFVDPEIAACINLYHCLSYLEA